MFANAAPARIGDTIGGGSRNSEACGLESFLTWPHFAEYHAFPAIRYGAWAFRGVGVLFEILDFRHFLGGPTF